MIAAASARRAARGRGEVRDDAASCACAAPERPRRRRHRRARPPSRAVGRSRDAGVEVVHRMKLAIARRRRVPRAAGLRRAARARRSGSGSTRSSLHDVDEARLARIAPVLDGLAAERGERLPFRATTDLDGGARGRRLRVLRDPRRPARGPRGRRARAARRRACSARRRPGPAASASRCARSR